MAAANVLFYAGIFSAIPNILEQNHKVKVEKDRVDSLRVSGVNGEIFDYIVVGGGSAGSVLANRLSRNRNVNVLLLERGGDPDPLQRVPMHAPLQVTPITDYGYKTVEQENCFFASGNKHHDIRGRGLGGSGNMNYMVYQRGPAQGYDEWAELTGDPIWSWENVLHYFKRSERYAGRHQPMDARYHSGGGELVVSTPSYKPSSEYFLDACREMGIRVEDLNTGAQKAPVVDLIEFKINRGQRWGPFHAFIQPALRRPNLRIYRYSQVVKVNVNDDMRATGVTYVRHGVTRTVQAKREIILSAGAFDTPKILMLSGIGPKDHLESFDIKLVKDLPVGQNHQDHIAVAIDRIEFDVKNVAFVPSRDISPAAFHDYQTRKTGPFSIPGGFFAVGYYSTSTNEHPEIPDIQFYGTATHLFGNPFVFPGSIQHLNDTTNYPDSNSLAIVLARPHTQEGELKLQSTDPADDLLIDPKYFTDSRDMPRIVEAVKYLIGIYENSTVYKPLGAKLALSVIPEECGKEEFRSDLFWECYIRFLTGTIWHPVGGCRMGRPDDPSSVVDSKLRVIGIDGLRVADGSIMPKIVNCNTQAPIYMIAELASQLILDSNRRSG